jgi:radical SAM superfamily enzyme YgiQ (UPF0313 family)
MKPLKIIMGDLTHETIILVSDTVPINIGFIASYANKVFGREVEISLFKYPQSIIKAIKESPPDLLALSNYSWNSNLSEHVASIAKKCNSRVITVQGGTNFPHQKDLQLEFLKKRPYTDIFTESEGEVTFSEIIKRLLIARDNGQSVFETAISGCVFLKKENSAIPKLSKGEPLKRLRDLDEIPSPYLNGTLDSFFDGRLTPFLETNRGCPFKCSFCHTGNDYYNKMNMFSLDRIKEDLQYIAPKMKELGIVNLHIADTNFGMFARDKEICEILNETREQYSWPLNIMATTGKNQKERVIQATQILGNAFSVNMSVQSMDQTVLKNIRRENIKLDHYVDINKSLNERGRTTKGEVIIGLPGETKESFVKGVNQLLNAGVSSICSYSLMLLDGTEFKDPNYRKAFDIKGKYRVVALNFGIYENKKIFDTEEIGIATKDMSFEEYLWIRGFCYMIEMIHNSRPFHEFFNYTRIWNLKIFDFIMFVYENRHLAPTKIQKIYQSFVNETKSELWDSETKLVNYFEKDENYQDLLNGRIGGNVIYKYKAMGLADCSNEWSDFLSQICMKLVKEHEIDEESQKERVKEILQISEFVKKKLNGVLQVNADTSPLQMKSDYDIFGWMKSDIEVPFSDFLLKEPIYYDFTFTTEQLNARKDQFKRYGTDHNALSKIVTRVSNVESLFRKINLYGSTDQIINQEESDRFVRYTLSN